MPIDNPVSSLRAVFEPRSIAVVGASRDPAKLGHVLLKNVLDGGFAGRVFPVNPSGGEILGLPVYAGVRDLPEAPDLVLLSIPNRAVPEAIRGAAARGARAAVVLASGFGEMGGEGAALQRAVRASGLRVLGPNCMGVYHAAHRLNATYFWDLPKREGRVAFVSQSGAYGGMAFRELDRRGVGISTFVSIGNQADVTHADAIEYLAGDRRVEVMALFIEEIRDGRRFLEACRRAARAKRVVAFKVGRTPAGRRAALSHTGSMAGDFEVCRSALRQAGVFVARETDEFFDALAGFSAYPRGAKGGLGIVTISGGPCVAAADACEEAGVPVPELAPRTQARVRALIPEFGAPRNPVDMTPQMDPAKMAACVEAIARDPRIGALLAINVGLDKPEFAEAFAAARALRPVLAFVIDAIGIARRFAEAGIPVFPTPERAVRAFAALAPEAAPSRREDPIERDGRAVLDEHESKRLLSKAGIAVCREEKVASAAAAVRATARLGPSVAMKALGAGAHKSRRGGVRLRVREADAAAVYRDLARKFGPEMIVQEMIEGGHEVLLGARRDPVFGPVVLFGSGGVLTEQIRDLAIRVCPIDRREALKMIRETRAGAHGDAGPLARMLVALSKWMARSTDVLEVDINPVITGSDRTLAVDALIVKGPARRPSSAARSRRGAASGSRR